MNILLSILILGLVVFIHELGHFLVAKAVKAPVYKFAIGMGPVMVSKEINGTEYSIRWIPLGGFVQLELEEELESEEGSAFRNLSIFKRGAVYVAGALFNFILAFILFLGIYFASGYPSTTIKEVYDETPAKQYGLEAGDIVIDINGNKVSSWNDIPMAVSSSNGNPLTFKINRNGKIETINVTPELDVETNIYSIGITPEYKKDIVKSVESSFKSTIYNIKNTFLALTDVITGIFNKDDSTESELSGPIGTIQVISSQTKKGFLSSIMLIISITISLGVFNLLPIPGLDGGKILILFIEFIRGGKKMSLKHETQITMVGVVILLGLMLIATKNDIMRLF